MTERSLLILSLVALGSAVGGALRFFVSGLVARAIGETFPWGTMSVNVSGSFLLGIVIGLSGTGGMFEGNGFLYAFAVIGVLGGFTTVSSLSLQTLALIENDERLRGVVNLLGSIAAGMAALAGGFALAVTWTS